LNEAIAVLAGFLATVLCTYYSGSKLYDALDPSPPPLPGGNPYYKDTPGGITLLDQDSGGFYPPGTFLRDDGTWVEPPPAAPVRLNCVNCGAPKTGLNLCSWCKT
jgi:hypothetical protein